MRLRTTEKSDGDFAISLPADELAARRAAVVDLPWAWLRQVHGADVVEVTAANVDAICGTEADAMVTRDPNVVLAIHTADCVPVVLTSAEGVLGAAHCGWRGVVEGVLDATVAAMVDLGATLGSIALTTGPHIQPECYEFGDRELREIEAELVPSRFRDDRLVGIRGTTSSGAPSLDMGMAVAHAMNRATSRHGTRPVALGTSSAVCTACEADRFYSHRARQETGRMATVAWLDPS